MFYIALIVLIFVGDLFIKNRVEKYIAIGRGGEGEAHSAWKTDLAEAP